MDPYKMVTGIAYSLSANLKCKNQLFTQHSELLLERFRVNTQKICLSLNSGPINILVLPYCKPV